jgi:hypothetical protein
MSDWPFSVINILCFAVLVALFFSSCCCLISVGAFFTIAASRMNPVLVCLLVGCVVIATATYVPVFGTDRIDRFEPCFLLCVSFAIIVVMLELNVVNSDGSLAVCFLAL